MAHITCIAAEYCPNCLAATLQPQTVAWHSFWENHWQQELQLRDVVSGACIIVDGNLGALSVSCNFSRRACHLSTTLSLCALLSSFESVLRPYRLRLAHHPLILECNCAQAPRSPVIYIPSSCLHMHDYALSVAETFLKGVIALHCRGAAHALRRKWIGAATSSWDGYESNDR